MRRSNAAFSSCPVVRPDRLVAPAVALAEEQADEERQALRGRPERVALEVEHDIAERRLGQEREAAFLDGRQQLVRRRGTRDGLVLKPCLLHQCREQRRLHAPHRAARRERRQLRERAHALGLEQRDVTAPQTRHARQMIDLLPVRLARRLEPAELTVVARDGLGRHACLDGVLHAELGVAHVRADLGHADRLARSRAELDVHPCGPFALDARDARGVEAELQRVVRQHLVARELRVDGLVGVGTERRRRVDPFEEIGDATPAVDDERRLIDHVGALAHELLGARGAGCPIPALECHFDDIAALGDQAVAILELVLIALREDHLRVGGHGRRFGTHSLADLERERRQMCTAEMPAEVGRREPECSVASLHVSHRRRTAFV